MHDIVIQNLRALKSMGYDPFITSALELKLDPNTMFEWQKHSQKSTEVPHFQELLEFLDLRAQASESSLTEVGHKKIRHDSHNVNGHNLRRGFAPGGSVASSRQCYLCKPDKHPLYACPKFKDLSHEYKIATLKANHLCMNCFSSNHFVKQCKSVHRCKRCQKPHHTLLHVASTSDSDTARVNSTPATILPPRILDPTTINIAAPPFVPQEPLEQLGGEPPSDVITSTAIKLRANTLLMTCRLVVCAPDGTRVEARALLDNGSSASFVSERLAQTLRLSRTSQRARISGVAGITHSSSQQSIACFSISPVRSPQKKFDVTAIIVPRVTCDLPFAPIPLKKEWSHLQDIDLADPGFGCPGKIDMLLGIDIFVEAILHGRRGGPTGTPMAFETHFGWVLAGSTDSCSPSPEVATCHVSCATGDDLLQKFWKMLRCLNLQISHSTFQGQPGRRWQIHCSSAQKRECQTIRRIKDPSSTSPLSVICTQRTSSKTLPRSWKNTSSLDTQKQFHNKIWKNLLTKYFTCLCMPFVKIPAPQLRSVLFLTLP